MQIIWNIYMHIYIYVVKSLKIEILSFEDTYVPTQIRIIKCYLTT